MHNLEKLQNRIDQKLVSVAKCFDDYGLNCISMTFDDGNPIILSCNGSGGIGAFKGMSNGMKLQQEIIDLPLKASLKAIGETDDEKITLTLGDKRIEVINYGDELQVYEFST